MNPADIKFMPADTSQFWRDPRSTSKSTSAQPTQPTTPPATHPIEKLRELFEAAING
jgi:hypothetical protein